MPNPWSVFEAVPTLITFPFDWKLDMGEQFPAFKTLCLQPHSYKPRHYPCSQCGCWHKIIRHEHPPQSSSSSSSVPVVPLATPKSDEGGGEGGISPTVDCGLRTVDRGLWTALCQCETPHCPDLHLTLEDITPLEANRAKL